ncbi:hypothetical protein COB55_03040 [Candidatus Wolfebacteria bacterium]|nr:MAG: hypothetical protein COB55_03040 [Candidatus Wolfebacteria bacterium]
MTQIKSLDELKDLDKAVFRKRNVYKDDDIWWFTGDGSEPIGDACMLMIKNWQYFEEKNTVIEQMRKNAPTCKGCMIIGNGCGVCWKCYEQIKKVFKDAKEEEQPNYSKYEVDDAGNITKDGHLMMSKDIASGLNRKSYLEEKMESIKEAFRGL